MTVVPIPETVINGMRLPFALTSAISQGRWRRPSDERLHRVFRERPGAAIMLDLPAMRTANRRWRDETDRAWFGHADERSPPGDIDRTRSLIIGVLGPDLPFALDYRNVPEAPTVVYLHSGGDRWITVARDVDELLDRLGLDRGGDSCVRPRGRRAPLLGVPTGARRP